MTSVAEAPERLRPSVPAAWLTPKPGRNSAIHRWFVFPHSFAPELASALLDELGAAGGKVVLDPFCGAGTTLVEAQRKEMSAIGVDLLPIAILTTTAKVHRPTRRALEQAMSDAVRRARKAQRQTPPSDLLRRALTPASYARLAASLGRGSSRAARCATLGTISLAGEAARLRADGGWLRAAEPALLSQSIPAALERKGELMLEDLDASPAVPATINAGDARALPIPAESVDILLTSPPYPNRHDYTRVFSVEQELAFGLGDTVKRLRYQALHSHPEARPERPDSSYRSPADLADRVARVRRLSKDPRVPRMLEGYFRDLFDVLTETKRVLRPGAHAAFVVGNARYCGVDLPVDDLLAGLAAPADLHHCETRTLRLRGNSAQQMGAHGRVPSRESVVILERR